MIQKIRRSSVWEISLPIFRLFALQKLLTRTAEFIAASSNQWATTRQTKSNGWRFSTPFSVKPAYRTGTPVTIRGYGSGNRARCRSSLKLGEQSTLRLENG